MHSLALLVYLLGAIYTTTAQSCPCGYLDSNHNLWREAIVSDFTQAAGALAAVNVNWIISTQFLSEPTGLVNVQYVTQNVIQFNNALGLRASAYDNSGSVKSGQIFTKRQDILYGTFRMRSVVPTVPGVVFGFFTYHNDTAEQDIEFLGSDPDYFQHVYYTNQPVPTESVVVSGADFTAFGEHRIDWLPSETIYSYSGNVTEQTTITQNVPTVGSEFHLNVWSNGNPGFSKGPPTEDAVATVQYVHLYFNSTGGLSATQFASACRAAGNVSPCSV